MEGVGTTALFGAAERGCVPTVRALLAHGASPHAPNANLLTPLGMAAMRGHVGVLDELAAHGANVDAASADGSTPLIHVAAGDEELAAQPSLPALRWLVRRGASLQAARTEDGATALLAAALHARPGAVEVLLEAGADPNVALTDGRTPLVVAAERGDSQMVRRLLEAGATNEPRALRVAIDQRESELIKLLDTS